MKPRAAATRGFTLIEILVTVAIVGLLAGMAAPVTELVLKREKERELRLALREIRTGIDAYKQAYDTGHIARVVGESGYPPTLATLVEGVTDAKSADKAKIYFLRRIPGDPMAASATPPGESWGLRSYESDADAPEEGADVFDVYSHSDGIGLNGVPYKQW